MKSMDKPTLISIFSTELYVLYGICTNCEIIRQKIEKKDFSMVLYNYISIIFKEKEVYIMEITSKTESVVVKYEGHVATVMVNRPEVLNALDEPTLKSYYKS